MLMPSLFIDITADKGRGIFSEDFLPAGTVVEVAPVIIMSNADREHLDKTLLHDYIFEWGLNKEQCCMALGFVPIYNHSYKSNCEYIMDYDDNSIIIQTVIDIPAGEELTINYNGEWNDENKIWFDVK
ncbi:MAG: nuclear protein [Ferruginibacter sp.]|nr:nuclear protein [Ferruginibacter sp.]